MKRVFHPNSTNAGNVNGGAENRAGLSGKARPYYGKCNGGSQNRRLAACATGYGTKINGMHPRWREGYVLTQLASNKTFETKQREKRIKDPSKFVAVRKKSSLCFVQLTRNLNDTVFRLDRAAERTKLKGRRYDLDGLADSHAAAVRHIVITAPKTIGRMKR